MSWYMSKIAPLSVGLSAVLTICTRGYAENVFGSDLEDAPLLVAPLRNGALDAHRLSRVADALLDKCGEVVLNRHGFGRVLKNATSLA